MFEMVGRKGRHVWLETRAVPFRNKKNEIIALLGITRDITGRRKLEEQLRQSQKMESIGTLAGGVAHDFNNILTAISGYGHLALMKMTPGDPNRMNIQQILESADRAAHLTRDLLLFSRKQPIDRKPVDLNEGIQRLSKFLARVIGEDIAFKTTLSGGAIPVLADAYQIDQVLMNLATNARDAMPKGGAFTITTEQVWLNESFTFSRGLGMSGKYAVISVSDTGQGMDEETRQRVFEPFFTTKEVGKGTGLGLSVVYGIVQQHDGQVTVYSEPGHGTTFRIYLPINETNISAEPAAVAEEPPVGGTETILLAEDDKTVREMTLLMLEDFGYAVVTAVDGEDAVKQFGENKDRVELLLFDLIMPGKSGKDAYDEIRLIRPDIKVIFASGYDPDMVRQKALLEQHVPVVYKPVPMATLLKTIRAVLDG
jgi:signal transduction histidine kinase